MPDSVEVRVWNDGPQVLVAQIAGRAVAVGPARIETVLLEEAAG
jgi:hypothetical protein